ncbi:hypothetical protein SBY92_000665 [Candida maltosa Xu316]|uniref:Uncharacterized protein n=1 Tax=Candida maltosa (strain Xu316) TaxID=1245528 RepID=M3JRJ1_CANMX|nr:hypothetical protein G210_4414 [Candida maltosa Xu316]
MVTNRIFHVSQLRTASRHWIPVYRRAYFSSQRAVNLENISESILISNDGVFPGNAEASAAASKSEEIFQPTIHGSEDVVTASPVNRA